MGLHNELIERGYSYVCSFNCFSTLKKYVQGGQNNYLSVPFRAVEDEVSVDNSLESVVGLKFVLYEATGEALFPEDLDMLRRCHGLDHKKSSTDLGSEAEMAVCDNGARVILTNSFPFVRLTFPVDLG